MKPIHIRILVYSLLAGLIVFDTWGIWSDFRVYQGDRVKEHLINISGFMGLLHLLLCGICFGVLLLYNRYTQDVRIAHKPLLRWQIITGFGVIFLNAAIFFISRK